MTTDPRLEAARSTALGALLVATASVLVVAGTERAAEREQAVAVTVHAMVAQAVRPPAPGLVPAPRPRRVVVVRRSRAS